MNQSPRLKLLKKAVDLEDLEDWRNFYVDLVFSIALIGIPAGLLVSLPGFLEAGRYIVIVMDITVFAVVLAVLKSRNVLVKRILFFMLLYTLLVVFLISLGPSYARPGWIIFSSVTASLLFGTPAALITVGLNTAMLSLFSSGYLFRLDSWGAVYSEPVMTRVSFIINISILSLASSIPVSMLLNRLNRSIIMEKNLREKLVRESNELHKINTSLKHEIRERERSEEEKEKLRGQLARVQRMESIGRLAGGIAHDYNNMLSVIIGNAEITATDESLSDYHRSIMSDILNAGNRSAGLTRQLLAFARKQAAIPEVINCNRTIIGMLSMLKRLVNEGIKIEWHPGEPLWMVKIDPSQLDQVLVNLVVNARDAISGRGIITIETCNAVIEETYSEIRSEARPGEYAVLTVSDNGCGMNSDTIDHIFEPFFTTKGEGRGTGLGLATVYGIVSQNYGFINVYSEPGHGTSFRIYLPRCADYDDETIKVSGGQAVMKGMETIMIVEDEESVLGLAVRLIESLGYTVIPLRKPAAAVELVMEYDGTIDLIITDVVMQGMNGRELYESISGIRPGIKCLFMSGYTDNIIANHGILNEGVNFIQKPFTLSGLGSKIRSILDADM